MNNNIKIDEAIKKLHEEISNLSNFYTDEEVKKIITTMAVNNINMETITDNFVEEIWDAPIRRCSHCGKLMKTGYLLQDNYACSDECRNELYKEWYNINTDEEAEKRYLMDCYNLEDKDVKGKTATEIEDEYSESEISDDYMYTEWD